MRTEISEIISKMTLEEKAAVTSGADNWFTKAIERLNVSTVRTSDGPHGLRLQEGNVNTVTDDSQSAKTVCFPAACLSACSFDRDLIYELGAELGKECRAMGVDVLLGPGVNIKRTPLGGRNFEYFSEDPLISGELGAAFVNGVQSQGVGVSLKHFFANNQEFRRTDASSEMDERTMREIYLSAFERIVKQAQPWTIMAAYNKIDGIHCTANEEYLTGVLRDEWGFEGLVMSDWGATHDRVAAIKAGCDLTMPVENTDALIVNAVKNGGLDERELDACVARVLELAMKSAQNGKGAAFDCEGGHRLAREAAEGSIVLLKNDKRVLPLSKSAKIAFVGDFAKAPRYQGGGSSHINSFKVANALDAASAIGASVEYIETAETAARYDAVVVFAGIDESLESEGFDKKSLSLPESHNKLIREMASANPNTIVVLHSGGPVVMPWIDDVAGVLEAYLGGQAIGEAVVNVLFGGVNPSGRVAESFPLKLADNPTYLTYPGEGGKVKYSEGLFVGYRYYESKKTDVLFPFGYGLSYTSFEYTNLTLGKSETDANETLTANVTVKNTGATAGKTVVQLYVAPPKGEIIRPVRELKGFTKIALQPGESKTVSIAIDRSTFAFWNAFTHKWDVEGGVYTIQIGDNAHDILLDAPIRVTTAYPIIIEELTSNTPMNKLTAFPQGKRFIEEHVGYLMSGMVQAGFMPPQMLDAIGYKPGDSVSLEMLETIAKRSGRSDENPLGALFGQAVSMLLQFCPADAKAKFNALLKELNEYEEN